MLLRCQQLNSDHYSDQSNCFGRQIYNFIPSLIPTYNPYSEYYLKVNKSLIFTPLINLKNEKITTTYDPIFSFRLFKR